MRNVALAVAGAITLGGVSAIAASLVQPSYTDQIAQRDASAIEDPVQSYIAQRDRLQQPLAANAPPAMAQHEPMVAAVEEGIEVQARRLPNGTAVAVRGEVRLADGKMLIIDRPDGRVQVRLPGQIPALMRGDDVTVYGRIANQRDAIAVRAEAVLQRTSLDTATLHVGPSKLESVNKFNRPLSNGAARNTLEYYRSNYTAL